MSSLYIDRRGVELEADGEALVFRENGECIGTVRYREPRQATNCTPRPSGEGERG